MELALYHKKFGYYRSPLQKFGAKGDFITAPETSNLFGYTLALQCQQIINNKNCILEFGAGSGLLASQILFELNRLDNLPDKYYILEISASLKQEQKNTIKNTVPKLLNKVVWLNTLPENFSGVIIANEVLDAMGSKRIIKKETNFFELGVGCKNNNLEWQSFEKPYVGNTILPDIKLLKNGYITEINTQAIAWINTLFDSIKKGVVLLIDYGMSSNEYFHHQREEGTLKTYYKHKIGNNPFLNIGKQDISVSVNFSDIALQAKNSGFEIAGYTTQAMFLMALDIYQYLRNESDSYKHLVLLQQIKQLLLPVTMGENFKVLALTKNTKVKLTGFKEQDLSHTL